MDLPRRPGNEADARHGGYWVCKSFCLKGVPVGEMWGRFSCTGVRITESGHHGFTNADRTVPWISGGEVVYGKGLTENSLRQMLGWDICRRVLNWWKICCKKFSKDISLVLDALAGTLSKPNERLFLNNCRRFGKWARDSGCTERSTAGLTEVYSCQFLSDISDLICGMK